MFCDKTKHIRNEAWPKAATFHSTGWMRCDAETDMFALDNFSNGGLFHF